MMWLSGGTYKFMHFTILIMEPPTYKLPPKWFSNDLCGYKISIYDNMQKYNKWMIFIPNKMLQINYLFPLYICTCSYKNI